MLTIKSGGSTDSDDTEVTVMPEMSLPFPAVMTLTPPVNWRMALRKSLAVTSASIDTARTTEFMGTSQVGSIFRPFQKILQDRAFQCRQFGRAALPWTRDIDAEIFGDAAVLDDKHAIRQRHGLGDVVRHQDRGKTLIVPDPFEQPLHRYPRQCVERAKRLVEREHARLADQRTGQRHTLLLSARQHRRPLRPLVGETNLDQRAFRARLCIRRIPLASEPDFDIRQHPRPWQQPRLLEHDADVFRARVLAEAD